MAHHLKRSLSSSSLQNLSRRNSFSTLERTTSRTSVQTTPMVISPGLNNESFQEFYTYLNGEEHYRSANRLWENLPQQTRDVFVAKVLNKKSTCKSNTSIDVLDGLKYDTAMDLFVGQKKPTKNSYLHYKGKMAPHFYNTGKVHYDSAAVSKIIGRIYNQELTNEDKKKLKEDTLKEYENLVRDRLYATKQYITRSESHVPDDLILPPLTNGVTKISTNELIKLLNSSTKLTIPRNK